MHNMYLIIYKITHFLSCHVVPVSEDHYMYMYHTIATYLSDPVALKAYHTSFHFDISLDSLYHHGEHSAYRCE